ncbi:Hypothetical_protein [Hexamita inflata]|uniref:Hypothetical_protein n=1 Tax=Hexamita inflata TaxID=28002 RepID=A0ABP1HTC1_9EUKA
MINLVAYLFTNIGNSFLYTQQSNNLNLINITSLLQRVNCTIRNQGAKINSKFHSASLQITSGAPYLWSEYEHGNSCMAPIISNITSNPQAKQWPTITKNSGDLSYGVDRSLNIRRVLTSLFTKVEWKRLNVKKIVIYLYGKQFIVFRAGIRKYVNYTLKCVCCLTVQNNINLCLKSL